MNSFRVMLLPLVVSFVVSACVGTGTVGPHSPQAPQVGIPITRGPAQPQPPRAWPAQGRCLEATTPPNCRVFLPDEIDAIRAAALARLAGDPAWSAAHAFVTWPVSTPKIGAYDGWAVDGFEAHPDAEVVLSAATSTPDADELWYRLVLRESPSGWVVLDVQEILATNPLGE